MAPRYQHVKTAKKSSTQWIDSTSIQHQEESNSVGSQKTRLPAPVVVGDSIYGVNSTSMSSGTNGLSSVIPAKTPKDSLWKKIFVDTTGLFTVKASRSSANSPLAASDLLARITDSVILRSSIAKRSYRTSDEPAAAKTRPLIRQGWKRFQIIRIRSKRFNLPRSRIDDDDAKCPSPGDPMPTSSTSPSSCEEREQQDSMQRGYGSNFSFVPTFMRELVPKKWKSPRAVDESRLAAEEVHDSDSIIDRWRQMGVRRLGFQRASRNRAAEVFDRDSVWAVTQTMVVLGGFLRPLGDRRLLCLDFDEYPGFWDRSEK